MAIQRTTLRVDAGFNPDNRAHVEKLQRAVNAAAGDDGGGWTMSTFDQDTREVTLTRRAVVTSVGKGTKSSSYQVSLGSDVKPADGDKVAAQLESDPRHSGYYMTTFDPHRGEATLTQMRLDAVQARAAVATALGVKPWDVQLRSRSGGGYTMQLPASYVPSKHDEKLQEVAEVRVGQLGWYFEADPRKLTAQIVPSDPPTFGPSIPYPMRMLPVAVPGKVTPLPFGHALAERGDTDNEVCFLDLEAAPHTQLSGTSGSGKSVSLNTIIGGALAAGAELAIVDVPAKAVDYEMWRPFVRKGGWGCESFEENAIALQEIYKEGNERAAVLKRYGAKKLTELPPDVLTTMPPVLIIADEVTGLFAPASEKPPKGLPSDHPLVMEAESKATASGMIQSYIQKIAAELRFVGFKLILSTQVASTATGIGTALRTNLGNKLLVGARATDGNRKLVLADVSSAPEIPKNIQQAEGLIPKGVGVAELEAQRPFVFKSFYASEDDFIEQLRHRGVMPLPETQLDQTRPDPSAVSETFPALAEQRAAEREAAAPKYGTKPRALEDWEVDPETGKPLSGFARANAAKHQATVAARDSA